MGEHNAVVAIYNTHTEAEGAIQELKRATFDITKLSIVGKDYHTEEHVVGYYNTGDRAIGAALFSVGIPKDSVLNYEPALKANKFLLVAHGTADEAGHARRILQTTRPHSIETHTPAAEEAGAVA